MAKRDSKGRFLKRGKRTRKRRRIGATATKRRRRRGARKGSAMAKRKRRRASGASGTLGKVGTKAKVFGAGAVYGYVKERTKLLTNAAGEPYRIDAIGQDATVMVAAHLAAKHGPRDTRRAFDYLGLAIAGKLGMQVGASGGDFKAALQGAGDDDDLVGALDSDDFEDIDDGDGDGAEDIPAEA